jgi:hypothetical protein
VYPSAPEATSFGERDTGFVAVIFFPRQGRPPIIQRHAVARWRWRDEGCSTLDELEALCGQDLKDCVVRLTLAMEVSVSELDRMEAILDELKGNEAAHGKAGVLQVDRTGLELNTDDLSDFEHDLPEVLQSVVARLQTQGRESDGSIARRALYHLYRTVREASQ